MTNTIITPAIFSKEVIRNLDLKVVFVTHTDRAYEWDLKKAWDTVRVQTLPTLTFTSTAITGAGDVTNSDVGTWPGGAITASDFAITLENLIIDKYTEKLVRLTDHQMAQSNLSLEEKVGSRFAEWVARLFDSEVRDQILVTQVANIPAGNKINSASPVTLTKTNIFEEIEKMRVALMENNVEDNLCLFVSPSAQSLLLQSGILDNTDKWVEIRFKGYIGMISGVKVYVTNALTASKEMIMMQEGAVNMVIQINNTKVTEGIDGFYTNILVQAIYGLKIFGEKAKAIAINYVA